MRLDKFLSETGTLSRSESKKAAKSGRICVNGLPVRDTSLHISPESDKVTLDGAEIKYSRYTYIMLNKPDGLVSATEDEREETVLSLLPENLQKIGLFPCGRLDKNTLGLLLLTITESLPTICSPPPAMWKKHTALNVLPRSRRKM